MSALGKKRVTVDIPDEEFTAFKVECVNAKESMSEVLRKCIKHYVQERQRVKIVS